MWKSSHRPRHCPCCCAARGWQDKINAKAGGSISTSQFMCFHNTWAGIVLLAYVAFDHLVLPVSGATSSLVGSEGWALTGGMCMGMGVGMCGCVCVCARARACMCVCVCVFHAWSPVFNNDGCV